MARPGKASYKPAAPTRAAKSDAKQALRTAGLRSAATHALGLKKQAAGKTLGEKALNASSESRGKSMDKAQAAGIKPNKAAKIMGKASTAMNKRNAANAKAKGIKPAAPNNNNSW